MALTKGEKEVIDLMKEWQGQIAALTNDYKDAITKLDTIRSRYEKNPLRQKEFWVATLPYIVAIILAGAALRQGECIKIGSVEYHCS